MSNGSASGTWTSVASLLTTNDTFAGEMFQVVGTTTQSLTGAWDVRTLDTTLVNHITSASVNTSTGTITLPAGTYLIDADAIGYNLGTGAINNAVLRWRNTSSSSTALVGSPAASTYSPVIDGGVVKTTNPNIQTAMYGRVRGVFTTGSTYNFQLQWYSSATAQTNNSIISGSGETPVLTNIIIWKIG